ncbi:2-dehydropantoate 2-reductase [Grosmannia clavigera kw1407]|uniref:2-dehydropantoate 2-reductase n=1 Tax=Grosmannia clavigera (strain kw1407 / UAMH 11150) TaxID=655863 RepID=F0XTC1_GROCL|nr:2-dehydropantoate 2-reductase [Grosmannia clavigera kw1407]EFW99264.1 2-dehydropantoate 2-reductase [Grosmannia clavigera kw1407]
MDDELMNVVTVGGNAVSAFLSWRLQATNACDVTLVWKSGFENVSQYGISFKSSTFGNERFKPRNVVRSPEDAVARRDGAFDYVILCIKALPDVYDLASIIDSVVEPQHTCILVNTTHSLGVEAAIEERFPTNVVLSLVSNAELVQTGTSEFEHKGSTEIWVGPTNSKNDRIPKTIREDMAQALAMTLCSGQVECKVSPNIRQQQYERLIGPIAFHPASVIFETPSHAALVEKVGVRQLISSLFDELLALAEAQGCKFPPDFKERTMTEMAKPQQPESVMWQDYVARRPMEVDTFLGSPLRLSQEAGIAVPRLETMYAIMHNLNTVNRTRPKGDANGPSPSSPTGTITMTPRAPSQAGGGRPMTNGGPNGMPNGIGRPRPRVSSQMGPNGRRPPVSMNTNGGPNGYGRPPSSRQQSRRGSMEGQDLEEFSHVVLYNDIPEGGEAAHPPTDSELALRERELQLRQREIALREQEMRMRRPGPSSRRGPPPGPPARSGIDIGIYDDDDEEDDYFDPNAGPPAPMIDPDNFDMMSVTSRKNRKVAGSNANNAQFRKGGDPAASRGSRFRPVFGRNRSSQIVDQAPPVGSNILDDPLLSFTSNRYGNVDRGQMHAESRANSLTASRLEDLQFPPGSAGGFPRRTSHSPGNTFSPSVRGGPGGRPSPPNGFGGPANGRPSPPDGVRQPVPRYPPGQGNAVAPQQVEQHAGVSSLQPPFGKNVRSLTGSASASAGSSDSAHLDSEPSAHSSQSSLGPRPPIGVR